MFKSHRFSILSNRYRNISEFEHGTNWGLSICQRDSHFKVLDLYKYEDKVQILLLHLDENWEYFQNIETNIEQDLISDCQSRFEKKVNTDIIKELSSDSWYDRLKYPIGVREDGTYFPMAGPVNANIKEKYDNKIKIVSWNCKAIPPYKKKWFF